MPRRVYDSLPPHQDCPKCRYPMLRAEVLGEVSDQISAFNPAESWIPALAYQVPLWVGLGWLSLKLSTGVIAGYSYLAHLPQIRPLWVAAVLLLVLELWALWAIVRWPGWRSIFTTVFDGWFGRRAPDPYGAAQARKPALSRDVRYSDSGLAFAPMIVLGFAVPLMFKLIPLLELLGTQHEGTLAKLLTTTVLLLGLLLTVGVPVFYDDFRQQLMLRRRRKREALMRSLAPSDWVCPNCLASMPAPPDVGSRTYGLSSQPES